jgi:hypothetical protein
MSRPAFACCQAPAERQNRFHRPRVNENGFPDPRRLPSTNAPSAFAERARHRTCGFACRRPASDALSPLRMLSHEGARSSTVVTGYSPEVVSDHATLADFCNRNEMRARPSGSTDPRTPRRGRPLRSFICGWHGPLSELSQPRFHGPGAVVVDPHQPLLVAIARDRSLTPTRSARAPPVANLLPPGAGRASAGDEPCYEGHPQGRQARPRLRET